MATNKSLAGLSDNTLLARLHKLVERERQTTLSILLHLAEVDRRDLYLEYGFSSLFDYCVGALRYSRSAAGRRIASARCIRRYPEVYELLKSNEANLCTVGLVAAILDDDNKDLLLKEIRGKTQRQVESVVARYKPPVAYRDRVRPVRVAVPELGQNAPNRRNSLIFNSRTGSAHRTNSGIVEPDETGKLMLDGPVGAESTPPQRAKGADRDCNSSNGRCAGKTEQRLLIQFLATEEFMAKLDEVKSLLSNKVPNATFGVIFEAVLDEFIDRHSPKKREERREKRRTKRNEIKSEEPDREKPFETLNGNQKRSRYIPPETRDAVFKRDKGKCTYAGKNGKHCGSTHNLQIDHIEPFARGGRNTLSNLRLLCGKHNRHEARRILGVDVMNRYVKRE